MKRAILTALVLGLGACTSQTGVQNPSSAADGEILVIAHRGASGYLPEHTMAAYQLAIKQGADFIEPDLVMTRDGVLVARHDPWLSDSTDIADRPEFSDRMTTIVNPEGIEVTDWFIWDFTLAELKTLRARQVRDGRDTGYDDIYEILTFEEILRLVEASDNGLGVYVETKWSGHHQDRDLDMLIPLLEAIENSEARVNRPLRIYIQSFEPDILIRLNALTDKPLVQLVYPQGWKADGKPSYALEDLATYSDGVGPYKSLVMDLQTGEPTGYADKARALGLVVHPWTFRDDDIAPGFQSPEDEIRAILDAGATGFFTDFPDTGRKLVDEVSK